MKTYDMGTDWKCLNEALLMSTHNKRFRGEIRKNICLDIPFYMELCMIPAEINTVHAG